MSPMFEAIRKDNGQKISGTLFKIKGRSFVLPDTLGSIGASYECKTEAVNVTEVKLQGRSIKMPKFVEYKKVILKINYICRAYRFSDAMKGKLKKRLKTVSLKMQLWL